MGAVDLIHRGAKHHVAEEGSFATSKSTMPVLQYFPCRGRAEPIRLVLSYVRQPWFEPPPMSIRQIYELMHRELDGYPFRQLPRFIDEVHGDVDFVQSGAILRHLGRKYDLYGKDLVDAGRIDMMLDAVLELRGKLKTVVIDQQLADEAVRQYESTVLGTEQELKASSMRGPGLASLEYVLARGRYSDAGWFVGQGPTLVDFAVFDLVDVHMQYFEPNIQRRFPALSAHHDKLAALPGVAEYLASDSRHEAVWAVEWMRVHELSPGGTSCGAKMSGQAGQVHG